MLESVPTRGRLSSAAFAFSMASFALFFRSFALLEPPSYWWHLAVGDLLQTWRRIPDRQLFLFTVDAETPWFYTSWFGEFLLAFLHEAGGGGLVLLVHNLLVALTVFITAYVLARKPQPLSVISIAGIFAALTISVYIGVTPWSFAMPFMALATNTAISLLREPRLFKALIFPGLTALLANLDLTSAFLLALLAGSLAITLFQKKTPLPAAILLLSPLGLLTFAYGPASLFSALAHLELGPAAAPALLFLTFILANRLSTLPQFTQLKLSPRQLMLATLVVFLAGVALQPGVPTRDLLIPKIRSTSRQTLPLKGVIRQELPLRCAEALRDSGKELRLFSDEEHAGFLLYHIQNPARPTPLLFQDHRPLLPREQAALLPILRTDPIARGVFQQYGINAAVVSTDDFPVLVDELERSQDWQDLQENPDAPVRCFLKIF